MGFMAKDQLSPRPGDVNLLYNLSSSFNAVLDLPELLRRIVEAAMTLTKAASGQVALIDPESAHFMVHTIDADGSRFEEALGSDVTDPLMSYVMAHREPLVLKHGDDLGEYGVEDQAVGHQLRVPLIPKGHPMGVLIATHLPDGDEFTDSDRDLLTALAGFAAIAIENALLYKQALDRSFELGLLVESANSISSSLDLGQVLNAIARHLMRALQTDWCVISSWNKQAGCVRRLAEYRSAYWPKDGEPALPLSVYPVHAKAIKTSKPQAAYLRDAESEDEESQSLVRLGASRILTLPLQIEGQVIGLAQLANLHKTEPFTPLEIGQSLRATLDITPLIRNEHAAERQVHLGELARDLCSTAGTNWCTFYAIDAERTSLTPILAYGTGIWYESANPELDVRQLPTLRVVLREQRVAILRHTDTNLPAAEKSLFDQVGSSAMIALPLVFRANTVGLVQLFDLNPDRVFTGRELGLARALSNQAAVALENAHLVRDLQRSFEELQSMQGHMVRAARLTALGELSAVVAHQINNPLTTILGDAEMLVADLPTTMVERESAQAILRAGIRAKKVVERILTMARGDDEARPLNVNATIQEMLELVGQQIRQYSIDLDVSLGDDLPMAMVSPGTLSDVWLNLLMNARDAIVHNKIVHGRIELASRVVPQDKVIEVTVSDNGGGIAEEHLNNVFDPFYTTKPQGTGTGLGLYIVRQIVTDHDGTISLDSTVGQGTTVSVRLPIHKEEPENKVWQTS